MCNVLGYLGADWNPLGQKIKQLTLEGLSSTLKLTPEDFIVSFTSETLKGFDDFHVEISLNKPFPYKQDVYKHNGNAYEVTYETVMKYPSIADFSLTHLPSCPSYIISRYMNVDDKFRKKGIASMLQGIKEVIAASVDANKLMATVADTNKNEISVLKKTGWNKIDTATSSAYGSYPVSVWVKDVNPDKKLKAFL